VGGYPVDPKQQQQMYDGEEDGDAHVVAGARGMMRYRRNRASTMEAAGQGGSNGGGGSSGGMPVQQQQQQLLPQGIGYGVGGAGAGAGAGGAPWAMYQTNGKPAVQVVVCALNCD
jgi:hypothetical protein